jgi:hypothetical protein
MMRSTPARNASSYKKKQFALGASSDPEFLQTRPSAAIGSGAFATDDIELCL